MPRDTRGRTTKNLSDEERARILELAEKQASVKEIAGLLGRTEQPIYKFLASMRPTGNIARRYAEAQAFTLTKRVVRQATVAEGLEVLDRIDVLPKKRDASGGPSVVVCVGMPGAPALVPPSMAELEAVRKFPQLSAASAPVLEVE